jgi:hypothetical protein
VAGGGREHEQFSGVIVVRPTGPKRVEVKVELTGGRNAKQVQRWLGHHSAAFMPSAYIDLLDDGIGEALVIPLPNEDRGAHRVQPSPHRWAPCRRGTERRIRL